MAADFLAQKRTEIDVRLREIEPLVDEYRRLEAAAAALDGVTSKGASATPAVRPAPARSRASRSRRGAPRRRGRPKGSGTRSAQALAAVKQTPGITIPDLATRLKTNQNYLYSVLRGLAEDGLVIKDGRGWTVA